MPPSFGRWYPLRDAAAHAPVAPGVLQVRVAHGHLLDYPRGKSAMVHYAAAEDVRAAAVALAAAHAAADDEVHADAGWLCRHTEGAVADPAALVADLVRAFTARFGCAPGQAASDGAWLAGDRAR